MAAARPRGLVHRRQEQEEQGAWRPGLPLLASPAQTRGCVQAAGEQWGQLYVCCKWCDPRAPFPAAQDVNGKNDIQIQIVRKHKTFVM